MFYKHLNVHFYQERRHWMELASDDLINWRQTMALLSNSYDCWSVDPDAQHFLKVSYLPKWLIFSFTPVGDFDSNLQIHLSSRAALAAHDISTAMFVRFVLPGPPSYVFHRVSAYCKRAIRFTEDTPPMEDVGRDGVPCNQWSGGRSVYKIFLINSMLP